MFRWSLKDKKKVLGEKLGLKNMGNRFGLERDPVARFVSWRLKSQRGKTSFSGLIDAMAAQPNGLRASMESASSHKGLTTAGDLPGGDDINSV